MRQSIRARLRWGLQYLRCNLTAQGYDESRSTFKVLLQYFIISEVDFRPVFVLGELGMLSQDEAAVTCMYIKKDWGHLEADCDHKVDQVVRVECIHGQFKGQNHIQDGSWSRPKLWTLIPLICECSWETCQILGLSTQEVGKWIQLFVDDVLHSFL